MPALHPSPSLATTAAPPGPPVETRITPEGGELRSADGRVRVTFPKGAVQRPVRVQHKPRAAGRLAPGQAGLALEFELNATADDAAAVPVQRFQKPLHVRVDLSGLVDLNALPAHQYYHLSYRDDSGQWEGVRAVREGNVLYATVDHFTLYACGIDNVVEKGWLLSYNEPAVSPFDGGFHYDYPIDVPTGRGGFTPDLTLSYASRRVDGILTWTQADWAGLGWSVDTMEIVRKFEPDYSMASGSPAWLYGWFGYQNEFTL
ncbi:MAG TPA: SpvB/TcaC N-terminal domain-containing protein, partial [Anaerolineae bacterium]|nr:SpvB/TcaC N-terminal domain-containing protein [Anaerolineae bacterium]